jgi:hypothetical protein
MKPWVQAPVPHKKKIYIYMYIHTQFLDFNNLGVRDIDRSPSPTPGSSWKSTYDFWLCQKLTINSLWLPGTLTDNISSQLTHTLFVLHIINGEKSMRTSGGHFLLLHAVHWRAELLRWRWSTSHCILAALELTKIATGGDCEITTVV